VDVRAKHAAEDHLVTKAPDHDLQGASAVTTLRTVPLRPACALLDAGALRCHKSGVS